MASRGGKGKGRESQYKQERKDKTMASSGGSRKPGQTKEEWEAKVSREGGRGKSREAGGGMGSSAKPGREGVNWGWTRKPGKADEGLMRQGRESEAIPVRGGRGKREMEARVRRGA